MFKHLIRNDKQFILSFAAVMGVGLTMISAIKDTTKACKLIDDDMTLEEKIKKTWKCYIPSSVVAASTMLCIMYSDHVSMNQKISMLNALMAVQNNYTNLRQSVDEVCDSETREQILKNTIKKKVPKELYIERTGEKIFYEEYTCKFFTSTIDNVLNAEYLFNKQLSIVGFASLNELYELLGISKTEAGEYLGWAIYEGYFGANATNPWVDFEHEKMEDDDGIEYYHLSYSNQPEVNYDMF
jgi:hypothetical protein